ncbi:MAG: alanine racemase [Balneolales bacterium]|nr:alanine racemase [Balneolales bacterium]
MMNAKSENAFTKGWSSVAEIDVQAIRSNLSALRSHSTANIKQMAVIKADAYGHGAAKVGRFIESDVDWIGVYQVREGAELRKKGVEKPILVFGTPTEQNREYYLDFNLTATVSDMSHFAILLPGTSYHIKFDTGMGRVGFLPEMLDDVQKVIESEHLLRYTGLMTHFANSEVPGSPLFESQKRNFERIVEELGEGVLVHASNSGATMHQTGVHYDMIRNGTAIYGFDPNGVYNPSLKPALSWFSKLVQVRKMPKGSGVSYSHTWHMPEDGYVGVIPVGYADGINRRLSNKMKVEINGKEYPQVGNVTMDQIMVYLGSDKPDIGEKVLILGGTGGCSAYAWADLLGTITYEVTCAIGNRVKRVYV